MSANTTQQFPSPQPSASLDFGKIWADSVGKFAIIGAIANLFIFIGSLGAWATVSGMGMSVSAMGTDGDGVITLILGLLGIAACVFMALKGDKFPWLGWAIAGMGLISLIIAIVDMSKIGDIGSSYAKVSIGWGLIFVLIFSIAAIAAGAMAALAQQKRTPAAAQQMAQQMTQPAGAPPAPSYAQSAAPSQAVTPAETGQQTPPPMPSGFGGSDAAGDKPAGE